MYAAECLEWSAGFVAQQARAECTLDVTLRLLYLLSTAASIAELLAWVDGLNHMRPAAATWKAPGDPARFSSHVHLPDQELPAAAVVLPCQHNLGSFVQVI